MKVSQETREEIAEIGGKFVALDDALVRAHVTSSEVALELHVQTALETAISISDALLKLRDRLKQGGG